MREQACPQGSTVDAGNIIRLLNCVNYSHTYFGSGFVENYDSLFVSQAAFSIETHILNNVGISKNLKNSKNVENDEYVNVR